MPLCGRTEIKMAVAQQYIAKGIYQYSQISNLVSVKNYIFLRQNGKKCLLIRFSNDLDNAVDSMEFTVIQLDSSGKVLEKTKVAYKRMNLMPGRNFSSEGIVVNEFCTDFKVVFQSVISDRYKYVVRQGQVIVYYIKKPTEIISEGKLSYSVQNASVDQKRFGKPRLASLVAVLAIILMLFMNGFRVYSDCFNYYNNRNKTQNIQSNQSYQNNDNSKVTYTYNGDVAFSDKVEFSTTDIFND